MYRSLAIQTCRPSRGPSPGPDSTRSRPPGATGERRVWREDRGAHTCCVCIRGCEVWTETGCETPGPRPFRNPPRLNQRAGRERGGQNDPKRAEVMGSAAMIHGARWHRNRARLAERRARQAALDRHRAVRACHRGRQGMTAQSAPQYLTGRSAGPRSVTRMGHAARLRSVRSSSSRVRLPAAVRRLRVCIRSGREFAGAA
jgi:hypothetical protein